jgi:DNA-binding MarR family transcriptional regulator
MNQADGASVDYVDLNSTGSSPLFRYLKVSMTVRERLEEELRAVGLSVAKFEVLMQLVRAAEAIPLLVLAEGQQCVPSNMTTLVDRLESEGLVRRVDDPSDRRSRRAQLTPEGESRAKTGVEAIERMNAKFDALMDERDGTQLERLLGKLETL